VHYAELVATTILMADEHPLIALHPRTLLVHAGANASGTPTASLHRRACGEVANRLALSVRNR
jgi:hypothetical protein